jgi:hypothetical protein
VPLSVLGTELLVEAGWFETSLVYVFWLVARRLPRGSLSSVQDELFT